jgi:hypothetical protein
MESFSVVFAKEEKNFAFARKGQDTHAHKQRSLLIEQ